MSFGLYTLGTIILIIGVAYVCHLAHVPEKWVIAMCILILGAGIMGGVSSTRQKDSSS